jgi:DNA-binding transcriptional LysR family regulator
MDRFAAMRVFIAVADAGSLSAAGRRLGMPLATVSRHLAALEEQLGLRLFTRTTRRLALTEPGRSYLETTRRVLDELDAAERRLGGEHAEPQGKLALTAPVVFGRLHVLPIVIAFLAAYPKVTARMLLVDRVVDLVEEGLDIGVRIGNLPDSSMRGLRVGAIRYVACASPAYLKRRGTPASPRDLEAHDCISFSTSPVPSAGALAEEAAARAGQAETDGEHGRSCHRCRPGRTWCHGSSPIKQPRPWLRGLRLTSGPRPDALPVHILHREDRLPQAKVQSFIVFAAPRLRAELGRSSRSS